MVFDVSEDEFFVLVELLVVEHFVAGEIKFLYCGELVMNCLLSCFLIGCYEGFDRSGLFLRENFFVYEVLIGVCKVFVDLEKV